MTDTLQQAELGQRIQSHLDAGRLREACDLLIQYCRINSGDANAWSTLGRLHVRHGDQVQAVDCLTRAVALDPRNTNFRMWLAAGQKQLGNLQEAARHTRAALDENPEPVEWWWELGDLSAQMEDFPVVEQCCREVLSRNPSIAAARLYLGIALQRQGRLREAEEELRVAIAADPAAPDAYFNLGLVMQSLGDAAEALRHYRSALDYGMESGTILYNMALLHFRLGRPGDALDSSFRALQHEPGMLKYRQLFVRALRACLPREVTEEMMTEILRCFNCAGIDSMFLMMPGMLLLMQEALAQQLVELAGHGEYDRIKVRLTAGEYDALLGSRLLQSLLLYTRIASAEFEAVLRHLRRISLEHVMQPGDVSETSLFGEDNAFAVALAGQFFNTEYAAGIDPEEAEQVAMLAEHLRSSHEIDVTDSTAQLNRVVVICMYQPLYSMPDVGRRLEERFQHVGGPFRHLFRAQWQDDLCENEHRQHLTRLTAVSDVTSLAVKEQYEQSPYPRWETVTLYEPLAAADLFSGLCSGCISPAIVYGSPDVLIAGCGTGRHAIMSASLYGNATVLAVDLSASSLAYAVRKAQELGVENIRFAQADILEIGSIGRTFHIIESVGVLHHLRNPEDGLQVLTGLLPVNGLIKLGLYSKAGRRDVAAARDLLATRGFKATADGIRCARMEIMALPADSLERRVTRFRDFYSLSGCRDLLFHVQEWCFDLEEIARLLGSAGLRFSGFEIDDAETNTAYRERFTDDPDMLDLDNWREFEAERPDTFSEMYQFWCQKV